MKGEIGGRSVEMGSFVGRELRESWRARGLGMAEVAFGILLHRWPEGKTLRLQSGRSQLAA